MDITLSKKIWFSRCNILIKSSNWFRIILSYVKEYRWI